MYVYIYMCHEYTYAGLISALQPRKVVHWQISHGSPFLDQTRVVKLFQDLTRLQPAVPARPTSDKQDL